MGVDSNDKESISYSVKDDVPALIIRKIVSAALRLSCPLVLAFYALQGENQYEDKYENNSAVYVDQYCQRTTVCKCLHLIGSRKVMGQRYSWVHRSREGILQDGKSGEFFPNFFSFESNARTRRAYLVLEIIVCHPHVPGRGSHPVRLDGRNDL